MRRWLWLLLAVGCTRPPAEPPGPGGLSAGASRGKRIYHQGVDATGAEVEATFSFGGTITGKAAACVTCHGHDGRGRREGGFATADLSPHLLEASYDRAGLERAITRGLDGTGRALAPGMPRYRLDESQARDLVAYLWEREADRDPGVGETTLSIGIRLPPPLEQGAGEAIRSVVAGVFQEANREGGVYRRRLELVSVPPGGEVEVLALVASHGDGWPQGVPVVGPLGPAADEPDPLAPVFHLVPSFEAQGRLAALRGGEKGIELEVGPGREAAAFARGARHEIEVRGLTEGGRGATLLFAGKPTDVPARKGGMIVPAHLPGVPGSSVVLPIRPYQQEFVAFLERHGIRATHPFLQAQAYAGARLLVEGLRRSGAVPTRASLIEGLESIRAFDTGVVPPLSFAPNRRVGAGGSWVVAIGDDGRPLQAEWIALPPR